MSKSPELRRYRGAVIGLGGITRQAHLPGFLTPAAAARLEIVATVDASPDVPPVAGMQLLRHREDLAALGIDFVDICTPTSSHLELILWALGEGYHVLCEKPAAITRREADQIRSAATAAGRVVMACHQYRFNPVWQRVRGWLDAGIIGPWHLAEFDVYRMEADRGAAPDARPWRGRRVESRGGVLLDHGTHLIYQLLDVAGPPIAIRGWAGRLRHRSYDVEDTAQLLFEYPNRIGRMFLTWAARRRENRIRFTGPCGMIEWSGGRLTLEHDGTEESWDHSAELAKSSYAGWFGDLFAAFAGAIDRADTAPLDDIAQVAGVLDLAYAAVGPAVEAHLVGSA